MARTATGTDGCRLEATAIRDGRRLRLSYAFVSGSSKNAYLFNRLFSHVDPNAVFQTERSLVYIELDEDRVIVAKKIAPVPPNMEVELRVIPLVTRVSGRGRFTETLVVTLPLTPISAYRDPAADELETAARDRSLFFELGYFLAPPEGDALAQAVRTSDGPGLRYGSFPIGSQRVLCVGPLSEVPSRGAK